MSSVGSDIQVEDDGIDDYYCPFQLGTMIL